MFQPRVKYEFVKRYCSPESGWRVFVDIDASEEGRTGGTRKTFEAKKQHIAMLKEANEHRTALEALGVTVGGKRAKWFEDNKLPAFYGNRDIVAFHRKRRLCIVAEVEGASSGQPEQKLYKAIGQLVIAVSCDPLAAEWERYFVLVVHGKPIAQHLANAHKLSELGIGGLSIEADPSEDIFQFGKHLPRSTKGKWGHA